MALSLSSSTCHGHRLGLVTFRPPIILIYRFVYYKYFVKNTTNRSWVSSWITVWVLKMNSALRSGKSRRRNTEEYERLHTWIDRGDVGIYTTNDSFTIREKYRWGEWNVMVRWCKWQWVRISIFSKVEGFHVCEEFQGIDWNERRKVRFELRIYFLIS